MVEQVNETSGVGKEMVPKGTALCEIRFGLGMDQLASVGVRSPQLIVIHFNIGSSEVWEARTEKSQSVRALVNGESWASEFRLSAVGSAF